MEVTHLSDRARIESAQPARGSKPMFRRRPTIFSIMLLIVVFALGLALVSERHKTARREAVLQQRLAAAEARIATERAIALLQQQQSEAALQSLREALELITLGAWLEEPTDHDVN
jgi:hypothetical protein